MESTASLERSPLFPCEWESAPCGCLWQRQWPCQNFIRCPFVLHDLRNVSLPNFIGKVYVKILGRTFHRSYNLAGKQRRGVRCENGFLGSQIRNLLKEFLLDFYFFGNGFDQEVGIGYGCTQIGVEC